MAPLELSSQQVRRLRLRAKGLLAANGRGLEPAEVVAGRLGVQAQESLSAALALWIRSRGLTLDGIEAARVEARTITRTWAMRGTLHLVTSRDLGWILGLVGPREIAKSRRRYRKLGLDEETLARSVEVLESELLRGGPRVKGELAKLLKANGIPSGGQAAYHLLRHAGLSGKVCTGPEQDGEATYAAIEDWLKAPPAMVEEKALLRRYWQGHGPASLADAVSWSGLTMTQVKRGLEGIREELTEVSVAGEAAWVEARLLEVEAADAESTVHLLPAYDDLLLGYGDRKWLVAAEHARAIHPGGGLLRPTLLVAGEARGIWRLSHGSAETVVEVEPFAPLSGEIKEAVAGKVTELSHFLGVPTELRFS